MRHATEIIQRKFRPTTTTQDARRTATMTAAGMCWCLGSRESSTNDPSLTRLLRYEFAQMHAWLTAASDDPFLAERAVWTTNGQFVHTLVFRGRSRGLAEPAEVVEAGPTQDERAEPRHSRPK